ncbi:chromate efflux transporter [uncultured Massilia sp.]|uniref:chromate efflux transporter n=1 Tax=uncultured Massilia sp. TaxID=169973 RepID=UPI0035A2BEA1
MHATPPVTAPSDAPDAPDVPKHASPVPAVTAGAALRYWLKLGCVSFGGPAGQIAMMHADLVERRRWISERRFLHALNYCMLLPGPEATQLAVYIGWLMHRTPGAIAAGVLFLLPSLLLMVLLSWIYVAWGDVPVLAGVLAGIQPAVVAIVLAAAWRLGRRTLRNAALAGVALAAFLSIAVLGLPFPVVVLGAALAGLAGARLSPRRFVPGGAARDAGASRGAALIDDDTPTPAHARFSWIRLGLTAAAGCVAVLACWAALAAAWGAGAMPARMGWFFTKAALMSFGGAYAVLPYLVQNAVAHYGWLTGPQMLDGLALGETTPGPLIMIVAFVGFVGGWTHGPHADAPLLAAVLCAGTAALFTFLPSFVFILAGGPLVEATRGNLRMTAPLTAISAAVVGVIASLAVYFGAHVFLDGDAPRWPAIAIGVLALVALLRYNIGTIGLLGACAVAGLLLS